MEVEVDNFQLQVPNAGCYASTSNGEVIGGGEWSDGPPTVALLLEYIHLLPPPPPPSPSS